MIFYIVLDKLTPHTNHSDAQDQSIGAERQTEGQTDETNNTDCFTLAHAQCFQITYHLHYSAQRALFVKRGKRYPLSFV